MFILCPIVYKYSRTHSSTAMTSKKVMFVLSFYIYFRLLEPQVFFQR